MLNEKINGETNMKYQNAVLENTISKYMEDSEEKKVFNYKIDRILELLQTQAQSQTQAQVQAQTHRLCTRILLVLNYWLREMLPKQMVSGFKYLTVQEGLDG